jgi:hypothetical protein
VSGLQVNDTPGMYQRERWMPLEKEKQGSGVRRALGGASACTGAAGAEDRQHQAACSVDVARVGRRGGKLL